MKRCLYVGDTQVKPGVPLQHLTWASHYINDKRPDILVQGGDWSDYPSLSSWDKGKASAENKRVSKDWDAFRTSVDLFEAKWVGKHGYNPRKVFTKGNHEFRVDRYQMDNPAIDNLPDVCAYLRDRGWETHEYLEVAKVDGVLFSHLFPRTLTGRITFGSARYGSPSANHMIRANMASCVAGHKPGFDYATVPGPGGKQLHGVIAGSFYLHNETYVSPSGDGQWKGVVMLNGFGKGQFDVCPVSIRYLKEKYGGQ